MRGLGIFLIIARHQHLGKQTEQLMQQYQPGHILLIVNSQFEHKHNAQWYDN